jgi:hypothetical protein
MHAYAWWHHDGAHLDSQSMETGHGMPSNYKMPNPVTPFAVNAAVAPEYWIQYIRRPVMIASQSPGLMAIKAACETRCKHWDQKEFNHERHASQ